MLLTVILHQHISRQLDCLIYGCGPLCNLQFLLQYVVISALQQGGVSVRTPLQNILEIMQQLLHYMIQD